MSVRLTLGAIIGPALFVVSLVSSMTLLFAQHRTSRRLIQRCSVATLVFWYDADEKPSPIGSHSIAARLRNRAGTGKDPAICAHTRTQITLIRPWISAIRFDENSKIAGGVSGEVDAHHFASKCTIGSYGRPSFKMQSNVVTLLHNWYIVARDP